MQDYLNYLPVPQRSDVISILKEFPTVTVDVSGYCGHTLHDIQLISGDVKPVRQREYRLNPEKTVIMKSEVEYLLQRGLAEPSNSPWASPSLRVPKPDGSSRFCTDYRKVNQVTVPDSYPLPLIEDLIDVVGKSRFLSKIDLQKGYYQIGLTDNAKLISAFITPFGLYQYTVMPFSVCNAPASSGLLTTLFKIWME